MCGGQMSGSGVACASHARARVSPTDRRVLPHCRALSGLARRRGSGGGLRRRRQSLGVAGGHGDVVSRPVGAGDRAMSGGWMRSRRLTCPDDRGNHQRNDRNGRQPPPPRRASAAEPEPGKVARRPEPPPGQRGNQADRRVRGRTGVRGRCLDRVVQCRRVLAPERIGRRGSGAVEFALGGAGPRGGSDRNQFLRRTQPVTRKPYDVLLVSQRACVFGFPVARSHGFADLSSVRVPVRLRDAVQYKPELAPVCLN